ncbi:hypothetical protein GH714_027767 [Hevea brasiliensis]|uniref:At1g61320/AtMIF1 LRR domain-containing protein n=1 Tax=Hevea brasiliensis TaxID=3981 RepID=A0A6A6MGH1_HEVBR|nr:hypothetical protein GH714_027767 [Hevea brasiliensis]
MFTMEEKIINYFHFKQQKINRSFNSEEMRRQCDEKGNNGEDQNPPRENSNENGGNDSKDHFSQLPEDALVSILSRLTLKKQFVPPSSLADGDVYGHFSVCSLTTLSLNTVDVSGEFLEHSLLFCCPFLEVLRVEDSTSLVSLRVSGPLLKPQYLEIVSCFSLKDLEISAASLVSFKYYGLVIGIPFKNVPNLVESYFGGRFGESIIDNLYQFSRYILRLQTLKFDVGLSYEFGSDDCSLAGELLVPYVSLLKACPLLYWFTLKISYETPSSSSRELHKVPKDYTLPCPKVVEVLGFKGHAAEIELVLHLLRNGISLDKIIIDPCSPCYLRSSSQLKFKETGMYQLAKQHAEEMRPKIPPGVDFVVL